ncbi:cache domain-containing sensor histidine kinase [Faecalicatena contorta]|uniref:Histidine kinase-, DNA gyrase B-, and HSP90-like ATPase n=1 Tax=Faecalicatena contorta TaxID=39482 RepID=A0A316A0F9_9FIRM|nr:sensor histidine kinase [Faecalicatena contorta]PWJ51321.1 histidine kinase/DNA gyrase B/HSP90-like ATPase [Faecalicatena contorta]SUQ12877.1 Histidine kinase-, DNA gyrase B-, and HSP90-like ATPase [Faecalicatena contorta]
MREKMTFRLRIMLSIIIVTISGLSAFFFFTYYVATDLVENNYAKSLTNSMKLRMEQIDEDMRDAYQKTIAISVQDELNSVINAYMKDTSQNVEGSLKVSEYLRSQNDSPDFIDEIFLYIAEAEQIISSQEYRDIIEVKDSSQYPWIVNQGTGLQPLVTTGMGGSKMTTVYLYAKPIYAEDDKYIGTVGVSINERSMYYKLLDSGKVSEEYFLLDGEGNICSARQSLGLNNHISDLIDISLDKKRIEMGIGEYEGRKSIYTTVKSSFSEFTLLGISEHAALISDLKQTQWLFTLMLFVVIILALILANKIADMLNKPLKNLIYAMERVGRGDFGTRARVDKGDEFYQLSNQFNGMVAQIDGLINQVVDEQKNARQSELRALQYQIKPHFMYNTLNSIKYMAIMQGNERVGKQLSAFIELLEASLNKGSDFSTLGFEIQLVKDYVSLQKYRYMGCFSMIYDISEDAEKCFVPRFMLQPLVENSILHGMDTKRNDNVIKIHADVIGDRLHIEVEDNGKGMTKEQKRAVLHHEGDTKRQFNGIGVFNTSERLRLFFGEVIQFNLQTEIGTGTKYMIEIPASTEMEEGV